MYNSEIESLMVLIGSKLKSEREKGIKEFIRMSNIPLDYFEEVFLSENTNITSSIINIMSQLGTEWVQLLFPWIEAYYLKYYNNSFKNAHLSQMDTKANHICNSLQKYLLCRHFDIVINYVNSLKTEVMEIRKKALYKFAEQYRREFDGKDIRGRYDHPLQKINSNIKGYGIRNAYKIEVDYYSPLTEKEIELAMLLPIEDNFGFNDRITHSLFDDVKRLTYNSFWEQIVGRKNARVHQENALHYPRYPRDLKILWHNYKETTDIIEKIDTLFHILYAHYNSVDKNVCFNEYKNLLNKYLHILEENSDEKYISMLTYKIKLIAHRLFPFDLNTLFSYIRFTKGTERRIFIEQLNRITDLYSMQDELWKKELVEVMKFIAFESDYNGNCLTEVQNIPYRIPNAGEISRKYLFLYLEGDYWMEELPSNNIIVNLTKPLFALFLLVSYGDTKALLIFQKFIIYLIHLNKPMDKNDIFNLRSALKRFWEAKLWENKIEGKKRDAFFAVGNEWENVCKKIAKEKYEAIYPNIHLPNGSIPDIVVANNAIKIGETISYAHTIIECKKSLYFTRPSWSKQNYNINENETTEKYKPYCDELQYWILNDDRPDDFSPHHSIKCLFAEDFINDKSINPILHNNIVELLNTSKEVDDLERILLDSDMLHLFDKVNEYIDYLESRL